MTQANPDPQARIIGFSPEVAQAAAIHHTSQDILQMTTDVQLALIHCNLGPAGSTIHHHLSSITRLAKTLLNREANATPPSPNRKGASIMEGYRRDIFEQMEPLAIYLEEALAEIWDTPWPQNDSEFELLRQTGMAAFNLARQIESFLALQIACGEVA